MDEAPQHVRGVEVFNSDSDWRDRGFELRQAPVVVANYDPAGDGKDRDAIVVLSREEHQRGEPHDPDFAVEMKFRVLMCQRMPQDYEFPDKLARMLALHRSLTDWTASGRTFAHVIGVESNGVGWGLASALREKLGNVVVPYTTASSSGEAPYSGGKVTMPRLAALDTLRIMMETHHLKLTPNAPGGSDLADEMNSFVWRRPGRPEAMDGQKDDLIMALCGALWIAARVIPPTLRAEPIKGGVVH